MARDLDTVMTRDEAVEYFDNNIIPLLIIEETEWQGGEWQHVDECHRSGTWNNWTDSRCKAGEISDWQYANWSHPDSCER